MYQNVKKGHCSAAKARHASFTPILATCDAVFDKEAKHYFKIIAVHRLQLKKWKCGYSQMIDYIQARMQIYILRSSSLCMKGSQTKWREAGVQDAAGLPKFNFE